ncbi:MAG TPA: OmpA family protein [Polyangiaceae bacterium]|jgi:OOP family OmpA-OmpF porin|nr:OmpA family protein [Polyangiaceae bacterium]
MLSRRSAIYSFGAFTTLSVGWARLAGAQETVAASLASVQAATSDQGSSDDDYLHRYAPTAGEVELGGYLGLLFISDSNSFRGKPPGGADALRPYSEFKQPAPEFGARVGYYPLSFLGAELEGMVAPAQADTGNSTLFLAGRAQAVLQVPLWSIVPFAAGGVGYWAALSSQSGDDADPGFHFGGGVKVAANDQWSFRLDVRDTVTNRRAIGDYPNNLEVSAGASLVLGRQKRGPIDADQDGILAPDDLCPNEAGPAPSGCPLHDRDGDQIVDSDDRCPDESGLAPSGCPALDADADGITDDADQCVNEPGVAPSGCPDRDADGVLDRNDQCPEVAGIAPLGCPGDQDQDGILDTDDKCPKEAETKNGYEDSDGCPDELPAAVKSFTGVIAGIEFDSGKDSIRPVSFQVLDQAAKILNDYPDLKVEIVGHTDDTGARDYNLSLSLRRAESVRSYLSSKGIDAARIRARGAGPDEPLVQEKTREARQKNRRIEFKIVQ